MDSQLEIGRSDGQVSGSAAEIYEDFFVPALFAEWAPRLADALLPQRTTGGDANNSLRCLDVACGTGVLSREMARRVGADAVTGIDINDNMLSVARRRAPALSWLQGDVLELPFPDAAFEVVGCQFALMFFSDRCTALQEMWRVLKPGGRLGLAVWGALDETPGYARMAALLAELFGAAMAEELHAPFCLGSASQLRALFRGAGLPALSITKHTGTARFQSLEQWVHTDIRGWTLTDKVTEPQFNQLLQSAKTQLADLAGPEGVRFDSPALLITGQKPLG